MAECNWDPSKHGGKPCPVHGAGGAGNQSGHKLRINNGKYQVKYADNDDYEDTDKDTFEHLRETALQDFDETVDDDFGFDEDGDYKIYEDKIREELGKVKSKEDAEYVSDLIDNNMEAGYISEEMADELYNELDKKIDEFSNNKPSIDYDEIERRKQNEEPKDEIGVYLDKQIDPKVADKLRKTASKISDATTYNGAEVIGGDDDNEGMLKNKTPLSEESSEDFSKKTQEAEIENLQKMTDARIAKYGHPTEELKDELKEAGYALDENNRVIPEGPQAAAAGGGMPPDDDYEAIMKEYSDARKSNDLQRLAKARAKLLDYLKTHDVESQENSPRAEFNKVSKGPVFDKARTSEKTDYNFTVAPTKFYKKLESLDADNPKQVAQIKRLAENYADDAEADIEYDYDSKTAERLKNVYAELASEISRLAEKTSDRDFADIASKIVKASKQIKGK